MKRSNPVLILVALMLVAACGGSGGSLDAAGEASKGGSSVDASSGVSAGSSSGTSTGSSSSTSTGSTFGVGTGGSAGAGGSTGSGYDAVQAIFDRSCAGSACHIGAATPAEGLALSTGVSYANLVGIPAAEVSPKKRVDPGSPDTSYLMCKLDLNCTVVGLHMPPAGALSTVDVAAIRAWIMGLSAAGADSVAPTFGGLATATSTMETSATLSWPAATDAVTVAADIVYRVYVGTTAGGEDFSSAAVTLTGQTGAIVGGLSPAQTYYFVVRATDKAGNVDANTVEKSAKTVDQTAPTFAGLGSATPAGATSIALAWSPAADNADAASAIRYRVYTASTSGGENFGTPLLTTNPGATSVNVTGLLSGATSYFVVRAVDTSNNADPNKVERSVTTVDNAPPTFGGVKSAMSSLNAVTLSWLSGTDNVTSSSQLVYLVYQAAQAGGENFATPSLTTPAGATSFAVGGLAASTKYYFVVRARDAAGNLDGNVLEMSATTPAGSDTTPPTFAGVSTASASSNSAIQLGWAAATDSATASAQIVYLVYRATVAGGESYTTPTYTTTAGVTSFLATGLAASTKYYFVVRAKDQAGNVDGNTKELSTSSLGDTTPPTFAGATGVAAQSSSSLSLSWNAATDDVTATSQIVYLVYQSASIGGESYGAPTYTTSAGVTSYSATGLSSGKKYYFVVRARDLSGNVDSNTVEVSAATPGVSFSGAVQPIFAASCASNACHAGSSPAESLNLSSASNSYTALVGVFSKECGTTYRVASGSPSTSYLMWKIQGSGSCFSGSQMPKGGSLSASEQATISSWIGSGAPNN